LKRKKKKKKNRPIREREIRRRNTADGGGGGGGGVHYGLLQLQSARPKSNKKALAADNRRFVYLIL